MAKIKYITNWDFYPSTTMLKAYKSLTRNDVRQMCIVVKATSRKNATEICQANDLMIKFSHDYSSETKNDFEIDLCNKSKSGIILSRVW